MASRIPVQIADSFFPSLNQARIFYTDILHEYKDGNQVNEKDQAKIIDLIRSSNSPYLQEDLRVCVARSFYGRMCFVAVGPNNQPHYMSIMPSLKKCAIAPPTANLDHLK